MRKPLIPPGSAPSSSSSSSVRCDVPLYVHALTNLQRVCPDIPLALITIASSSSRRSGPGAVTSVPRGTDRSSNRSGVAVTDPPLCRRMPVGATGLDPDDADAEHDGHIRDIENSSAQGPIPTFMKSITVP